MKSVNDLKVGESAVITSVGDDCIDIKRYRYRSEKKRSRMYKN
jgi:hypothetical protein